MPTVIDCPSCTRKLRVPDELLGQNVKCPTCGGTFEAAASAPPPAPTVSTPPAAPPSETPPEPTEQAPSPPTPRPSAAEADGDYRPCPYCGERIRKRATRCRYCDEDLDADENEDEEERPWERAHRTLVRRDCEPHRGTLILVLGIVSIVLAVTWIVSIVGVGIGIAAWVMGHRDLKKIRDHVMDPNGQGTTQAGWICGIIGTILSLLSALACAVYIGFIALMVSSASKMTPPPPPPRSVPMNPAPPRPVQPPQKDVQGRAAPRPVECEPLVL